MYQTIHQATPQQPKQVTEKQRYLPQRIKAKRGGIVRQTALPLQMYVCIFHFLMQCACRCVCVYTPKYVGCHSYQNANLTASLLQTTFTQKKRCFPPIHPSIHSPVHLLFKSGSSVNFLYFSYTTHYLCVCMCVYTSYVCVHCMYARCHGYRPG